MAFAAMLLCIGSGRAWAANPQIDWQMENFGWTTGQPGRPPRADGSF
ncbi:MAG TPA: hypothetical protein VK786_03525 [bacterium]|nr:hypothetical protein [bacterium]